MRPRTTASSVAPPRTAARFSKRSFAAWAFALLCLVVGDGALRYPSVFAEAARTDFGDLGDAYPSAAALVELAHPKAIREEFVPPWELRPLYLRKADAEINWETRDRHRKAG